MLITLSGLPGSGTSTVARMAAAALGLDHLDGGTVFRTMAAERGMTLSEFAALAERDDSIDRALDDRLTERARSGDVLLESRLAGWLTTRAEIVGLKVWIACDDHVRAERVAERDGHGVADAVAHNREREASERARYQAYYGVDLTDLSIYDLVLDSAVHRPPELVEQIVAGANPA